MNDKTMEQVLKEWILKDLEEVKEHLVSIQSVLPEGTFLVVEKGCVELYHTDEFLPTPVPNNIAPLT